ncbi:MAG TPA: tetratricopeptide repeat protein [Chitinophagales bacterium]|nr:tetratricopeptide repeat protein [Chitinophagales bacterium]
MKKTIVLFHIILFYAVFFFSCRHAGTGNENSNTTKVTDLSIAEIDSIGKKANEQALMGQIDKALRLAKKGYAASEKIGYKQGICMSMNVEGRVLYRKAKYDSSLFILNKALELAMELNDSALQSSALLNIGNAYSYKGSHTPAIEYYFKGLEIEEKLKKPEYLQWYFNNIGVVFATQKNYEKGLEYFLKSKNIAEKSKHAKSVDLLYNNIGWVYMLIDKKDSALTYLNRSLQLSENSKDRYTLTLCLHNLGELYLRLQKYEKAFAYSFRSYEVSKQYGYRDQVVANLETLGNIRLEEKKYDEAENYLLQGINIAKNIDAKVHIITVSSLLARIYEEKQDYEKAYDYYALYSSVNDTVLNQVNSKRIAELNTKYMTEQKEKQIELLKKNEQIQSLAISRREDQLKQQRNINISVFIGFLLLAVVAGLLYTRYRLNKKINHKLQKAFSLIEEKNDLIEKSNAIITNSIAYAKHLQDAILSAPKDLTKTFSEDYFILHKPSHIVSGDFYWCTMLHNKIIIVVADCTGHGVPGAFMSMIGNALLNEIVNEGNVTATDKIAALLDKRIIQLLHQHENSQQYDGMDISICCIDKTQNRITYTGARHNMYAYNGQLKKIKGDGFSLGGAQHQQSKIFTEQVLPYEKGLQLYLLTDGFCDQSGGEANKRFSSRQFESLLIQIQHIGIGDQKEKLEKAFDEWKGNSSQRDDVLVVGIKC